MSPPVSKFSRLSLEAMPPPATPTRSRETPVPASPPVPEDESSSELDSDSDSSELDEDSPVIRSPTKLNYRVEHLPDKTKANIRDVFGDPPKMALQRCRSVNNNTYAFQMTELVTRSIRIRASDGASPRLTCSCEDDDDGPCRHLLWLLDQVLKQTLYDYDGTDKPLTMTPEGFAEEMGDPFKNIASYHLDILADGLHCQLLNPDADEALDAHRVQESRELLSSIYTVPPDEFRPDIFTDPGPGKKVLKRNDLDRTVFRMLLDNHHFFQYFLSLSQSSDPINDPFRKLFQRVDRVLSDLDDYTPSAAGDTSAETPRDVAWAATHIVGSVKLINRAIFTRDRPLQPEEAISAARALVHILEAVVGRNRDVPSKSTSRLERNLYLRLVGDRDGNFVLQELNLLPEAASQFLNKLEAVLETIGVHGAPPSYVDKFRKLLARLRTSTTGSGLKRHGQSQGPDRGSKRMK